ncbi:MAG: hypothetical protein GY715_10560 [Planctomycetes bacterium]|nr:hypothetical protein [Planctomycetota bacterium]
MPSQQERHRNNVKTGIFVTVVIVVTVAVIVQLTKALDLLTPMDSYTVSFAVESGVENLKSGGAVRVGGHELGKVVSVTPDLASEPFETILVDFKLDRRVKLFDDAQIHVSKSLLGGDAWLDIPSVGTGVREPGDVIAGVAGGGLFGSLLGDVTGEMGGVLDYVQQFPDNEGARFSTFLDNAVQVSTDVKGMTGDGGEVDTFLKNAVQVSANAREVSDDAREQWPKWRDAVSTALKKANEAIEVIDAFAFEAKDTLDAKRPQIDKIVDNVEAGTEHGKQALQRFNEHTLGQFEGLMTHADEGLSGITGVLNKVGDDYGPWSEDFSEILANAMLASQQLKLTTAEVRRAPWKLLYRPEDVEFQHEMLYDAARSFAIAVADLKVASRTAQRMLDEHGDELASDPELSERLRKTLLEPLGRYDRAQQNFLDILVEQGK